MFSRFAIGPPTPGSGKPPSASSRTISVHDRDTKKLDDKGSGVNDDLGLAPLDEEDVLATHGRRKAPEKPATPTKELATGSDAALPADLATSSDVVAGSGKGSSKGSSKRSLIEEELHDPDLEAMKRKIALRAQYNPLRPPNYVPPNQGMPIGVWLGIGAAILAVIGFLLVVLTGSP